MNTNATENEVLRELRSMRRELADKHETLNKKIDSLALAIHGDDGEAKSSGLVRRVDSLNFRVKFATWALGTIFTAGAFGYFGHWFDARASQEQVQGQR